MELVNNQMMGFKSEILTREEFASLRLVDDTLAQVLNYSNFGKDEGGEEILADPFGETVKTNLLVSGHLVKMSIP